MKKLYEIVAELEAELATCTPEDYPRVCVELCRHLNFVDTIRTAHLIEDLLASHNLEHEPVYHVNALVLGASCAMNQINPERAEQLANQALDIANKNGLKKPKLYAQTELVASYLFGDKLPEAIALGEEIHRSAKITGDVELLLTIKSMLVHVYNQHDHNKEGLIAFEALELTKLLGKDWLKGYITYLLGFWAKSMGHKKEALLYLEEARDLFLEQGAKEYLINASAMLADSYCRNGDFDYAIEIQHQALLEAKQMNNPRQVIVTTYHFGLTYQRAKDYSSAERLFIEAIRIAKFYRNSFEEASASTYLANLYEILEKHQKAIDWFEQATQAYGTTIGIRDKMVISNHLNKLYAKIGNHEKAYEHLLNYLDIKLKLQDEARIKETTKLQQLYEKEKRETELQELTIKQQQTELQQAESELKAIRAQMNPHFIFNALNTIQSYIYLKDNQNASNYLGKFSRLTRMILDMSNNETVSLKDELEALNLYLQLERMRFEEVLTFNIAIADALDTESIKLPAMLIQPYIENAIKHGLLHKKDNRELHCSFELRGNNLVVSIDDNGIGRQRSMEMNATKGGDHKSFATQANAKRFTLLNKNSDDNIGVVYTDKTNADGQPAGTLVVLTIPVQFDGVDAAIPLPLGEVR